MKHRQSFTPGPWVSGPDIGDLIGGADPLIHVIQSSNKQFGIYPHIANIGGLNQSNTEIEANARLIAAAPELLDWLQSLVTQPDKLDTSFGKGTAKAIADSIARAVGVKSS